MVSVSLARVCWPSLTAAREPPERGTRRKERPPSRRAKGGHFGLVFASVCGAEKSKGGQRAPFLPTESPFRLNRKLWLAHDWPAHLKQYLPARRPNFRKWAGQAEFLFPLGGRNGPASRQVKSLALFWAPLGRSVFQEKGKKRHQTGTKRRTSGRLSGMSLRRKRRQL